MRFKNPYNLCTWDENSDCGACSIQKDIACKWHRKILHGFYAIGIPPVLVISVGLAIIGFMTGNWWLIIVYLVYSYSMFLVFEIKFLCSHCPYYAEPSKTLHCHGNNGSPKFWKYDPSPMNRFEKFLMVFAVVIMIFFIMPVFFLGYGIWHIYTNLAQYGITALLSFSGLTLACILYCITFTAVLKIFFCTRCVNFSCPLNTVAKGVVDRYLIKNPVMKDAWEKSGYSIGESQGEY